MNNKIFKQMRHDGASNLWLIIELIILSSVAWWMGFYFWNNLSVRLKPYGLDINNVYKLEIKTYSEDSPLHKESRFYVPAGFEDASEEKIGRKIIVDALEESPLVVAVTPYKSAPVYSFVFQGNNFWEVSDTAQNYSANSNCMQIGPDFFKVFPTTGIHGESAERLNEIANSLQWIVTSNTQTIADPEFKGDPDRLYNLKVTKDKKKTNTIGAVIPPVKRVDFEDPGHSTLFVPREGKYSDDIIYVRVQSGKSEEFEQYLAELNKELIADGNSSILSIKRMEKIREDMNSGPNAELINYVACILFLILMIFLGILGTFWYRTRQRIHEIAIRKVTGATNGSIFMRLLSEGIILLLIATPFALGIDWYLLMGELGSVSDLGDNPLAISKYYQTCTTGVRVALITFLTMALIIIAGISLPARKAVRVDPAEVLRGE